VRQISHPNNFPEECVHGSSNILNSAGCQT
jgi:hypothetical protein